MKEQDVILLRDPDARWRLETARLLGTARYDCEMIGADDAFGDILARRSVHALVVRGLRGVALCRAIHRMRPEIKTVLIVDTREQDQLIDAFNERSLFRCLPDPPTPAALVSAVRAAVRMYEMERVQALLLHRAQEIDRQIYALPYWLYRLRASIGALVGMVAGSVGLCIVAGVVLLMAAIGMFLVLYYMKSALGIDICKDRHLRDFLPL